MPACLECQKAAAQRSLPHGEPTRWAAHNGRAMAWIAAVAFTSPLLLGSRAAFAQSAAPAAPRTNVSSSQRWTEVRLAMSPAAAARFSEPRYRRLLNIELQDTGVVATALGGPMGDQVAYVWIDLPQPNVAVMEVRVGGGPIVRRTIDLSGLGKDVGARFVAIAVAEMVHAQPGRGRKPPASKSPSPEQLALAARSLPTVVWTGGASGVVVSDGTLLGGSTVSLAFRNERWSQRMFARWVGGGGNGSTTGWLEAGLGADFRLWATGSWRIGLGGVASGAAVHLGAVRGVDAVRGVQDSWSARAGAMAAIEARVGEGMWVGLALEPAAILRPVSFEHLDGAQGKLHGLWIGLDLALHFERRTVAGSPSVLAAAY
jgi:hypothetical protein